MACTGFRVERGGDRLKGKRDGKNGMVWDFAFFVLKRANMPRKAFIMLFFFIYGFTGGFGILF
ncbi:hypothetical protein [Oxalobacter paraformigenes]|uniref:Uncharacterized protein n=1 Tax=Oxalobacter paraformigenes TaxID=556268 RepID=T5LPZ2_9BURK|nr:hypothetical protein [Oxalobacter paraformigenes]EQM95287.1 hypothetical protein OFAG_02159 [Oxalobacter paraformigenes]